MLTCLTKLLLEEMPGKRPTRRAGLYFQSHLLLFLQQVRLEKPLAPLGSCACAFVYTFTPFQNVLLTVHSVYMASLWEREGELRSHLYPSDIVRRNLCVPSTRPHFTKGSQVQPAPGAAQGTQLLPGGAGGTRLQTCVLTHRPDCTRVAPTRALQHRSSLRSFPPGLGAVVGGPLALPHGGDHLVMILLVLQVPNIPNPKRGRRGSVYIFTVY